MLENEIDSAIAKYKAKKEKEAIAQMAEQKKKKAKIEKIELFLTQVLKDEKIKELLTASDEEIYLHRGYNHFDPDICIIERCGVLLLSNPNGVSWENISQTLLEGVGDVEKVKEVFDAEICRIIVSADSDE